MHALSSVERAPDSMDEMLGLVHTVISASAKKKPLTYLSSVAFGAAPRIEWLYAPHSKVLK
jgi:hypothetical protein